MKDSRIKPSTEDKLSRAIGFIQKMLDGRKNCQRIENDMNFHLWDENHKQVITTFEAVLEYLVNLKNDDYDKIEQVESFYESIMGIQKTFEQPKVQTY